MLLNMHWKLKKIKSHWSKEKKKIKFDGKVYWNINDGQKPCHIIPLKKVLPSDWRFREDYLYLI